MTLFSNITKYLESQCLDQGEGEGHQTYYFTPEDKNNN